MHSVVLHGALDLRLADVPTPEPAPGQVRLRVEHVGICGSDLHYYADGANGAFVITEPLVPGHELVGRVDLDPSGALAPGTPVTVHPARPGPPVPGLEDAPHVRPGGSYLGSAATRPHTQGAMSELLVVDAGMVRVLPDDLPPARAVLAEPLAVALHAVGRAAGPDGRLDGARVLVSGAGPIGLLAVVAARARGAAHVAVADVRPEPLERAVAQGADAVVLLGRDAVPPEDVDVVLECSGVPVAVSAALAAVRRRGTVVQVGMVPDAPGPVALAPLVAKEVTLVGSFRFDDEIDEAVRLLAARPETGSVVTHVLPLEDAATAFELAGDAARSGKVVVAVSR